MLERELIHLFMIYLPMTDRPEKSKLLTKKLKSISPKRKPIKKPNRQYTRTIASSLEGQPSEDQNRCTLTNDMSKRHKNLRECHPINNDYKNNHHLSNRDNYLLCYSKLNWSLSLNSTKVQLLPATPRTGTLPIPFPPGTSALKHHHSQASLEMVEHALYQG